MSALALDELARVTGGWGLSLQGQAELPGGGNAQGGFTIGSAGVGFGVQGQAPLPWGGTAKGTAQAGNFSLPPLP